LLITIINNNNVSNLAAIGSCFVEMAHGKLQILAKENCSAWWTGSPNMEQGTSMTQYLLFTA